MSRRIASRPPPLLRPPPKRRTLAWSLPAGVGAGLLLGAAIGGSAGPWGVDQPEGGTSALEPQLPSAEVVALREELAALRRVVAEESERVARLRAEAESLRGESQAAAASVRDTPVPAASMRAEPVAREQAPRPAVARDPPARVAAVEPASPRAPAPAPDAAASRLPPVVRTAAPRIFVHYRAGSEAGLAAAQGIAATLREGGLETTVLRPVEGVPSQRVVRFFHAEDASAAARLAGQLGRGWAIQDFRTYAPSPSPQLLEVWIPER